LDKARQNYQKEVDKREARESNERSRKKKVWEWIKSNDKTLERFILNAPKGFIKNVRIEWKK